MANVFQRKIGSKGTIDGGGQKYIYTQGGEDFGVGTIHKLGPAEEKTDQGKKKKDHNLLKNRRQVNHLRKIINRIV